MYYREVSRRLNGAFSSTLPSVDTEIRQHLIESLIEEFDTPGFKRKGMIGRVGNRYYAIRNSDLNILESLMPLVPPALTAQLNSPDAAASIVSSTISTITALLILLLRLRKRRVALDATDGLVLLEIKKLSGVSRRDLLELVPDTVPTIDELGKVVNRLKAAIKNDGTQVALVTEDKRCKLYAADV